MNNILITIILCFLFIYFYTKKDIFNYNKSYIIQRILRGSARWSIASKQDKSPLIAVLHGNYGAAYLWALKEVFNDNEISLAMGKDFDIIDFQKRVTDIQDFSTKRMVKLCPEYTSGIDDKVLSVIAGNN
jgi:hypothetical protein